jgi:hypothetical protein
MQTKFFMPFGLFAGQLAIYLPDYEQETRPMGIDSYSTYNNTHIYVSRTLKEFPDKLYEGGQHPKHHIAFLSTEVPQPETYVSTKRKELYRIVTPKTTEEPEDLETFDADFSAVNEIYYLPLNEEFFKIDDWSVWLLDFVKWVNGARKSAVVHATETVPRTINFSMLHNMPNIYVFQTHTEWHILEGVLYHSDN